MKLRHPALAIFMLASLCATSARAAASGDGCEAMHQLISRARNDFPSLRELKMQPGACTLRGAEYRCAWVFPGDSFAAADAEKSAMVRCAANITAARGKRLKGGKTEIELDLDTAMLIADPQIESGQWQVVLRIVTASDK
jgi:hypothetical protein